MLNLVILQLLVPKTAAASEPMSLSAAPCSEVYGSAGAINEAGSKAKVVLIRWFYLCMVAPVIP